METFWELLKEVGRDLPKNVFSHVRLGSKEINGELQLGSAGILGSLSGVGGWSAGGVGGRGGVRRSGGGRIGITLHLEKELLLVADLLIECVVEGKDDGSEGCERTSTAGVEGSELRKDVVRRGEQIAHAKREGVEGEEE